MKILKNIREKDGIKGFVCEVCGNKINVGGRQGVVVCKNCGIVCHAKCNTKQTTDIY